MKPSKKCQRIINRLVIAGWIVNYYSEGGVLYVRITDPQGVEQANIDVSALNRLVTRLTYKLLVSILYDL